jgi:pimeloyl-ACP methyl ester carboxylesterase
MGGPGGHAIESVVLSFDMFAPFVENRDLIVFDQRGTGFSQPSLNCQELTDLVYDLIDENLSIEEIEDRQIEAVKQCRDRITREGINLSLYNSAQSAADLNDLRMALDYESWNILGISYGTRLALTAMRDFPDGIRSVILDSVYPP